RHTESLLQDSRRCDQSRSDGLLYLRQRREADELYAAHAPARQGYALRRDLSRWPQRDAVMGAEVQLQLADDVLPEEACVAPQRHQDDHHRALRQFGEEQVQPRRDERHSLGDPTYEEMMIGWMDY